MSHTSTNITLISTTIMHQSIPAETVTHILSLLEDGKSLHQIQAATGYHYSAISKLHSKHFPGLFKAKGGRPSLLTTANLRYATRLIQTGKADTAPEVARALGDVTGRVVNSQTMCRTLKKTGLKAVVKQKGQYSLCITSMRDWTLL